MLLRVRDQQYIHEGSIVHGSQRVGVVETVTGESRESPNKTIAGSRNGQRLEKYGISFNSCIYFYF